MADQASNPKRILVTGSTGAIGQPVCEHLLSRGHTLRGFARRPTPGLKDYVVGDLNDAAKVREAVEGMEMIIHLGAYPNDADFMEVLLEPNVVGLYYVCEAAAEFGVERLILSSTVQTVTGHRDLGRTITLADGPAPVNHYALTKVWAEVAGDMYARVHDLSVISVRIGWLPRNADEAQNLVNSQAGKNMFFSHEDAKLFYERCVESENPPAGESVILFAASKAVGTPYMDLEPAKEVIGYEPQDVWPQGLPFDVSHLV